MIAWPTRKNEFRRNKKKEAKEFFKPHTSGLLGIDYGNASDTEKIDILIRANAISDNYRPKGALIAPIEFERVMHNRHGYHHKGMYYE